MDDALPYTLPTPRSWNAIATFYHPLMAGSIDGTDTVPHDRAVVRALRANYKPNKMVSGDSEKTLMIRQLSPTTTEETVESVFSKYGKLVKCRLVRDVITGKSRRYAFVEFKHSRDSRDALRNNDVIVDGCKVVVDGACGRALKGWVPRRLGGGFGGKKESGQLRFGGVERPFRKPIPVESKRLGEKREIVDFDDNKPNKRFRR